MTNIIISGGTIYVHILVHTKYIRSYMYVLHTYVCIMLKWRVKWIMHSFMHRYSVQNNSLTKDIFQGNTLFVREILNLYGKDVRINFSKLEAKATVKLLRNA